MKIIIELITFIVTFGFTLFWASNILIPIVYSLPCTIWGVVRGRIKFQAILICIIAPVAWAVIPLVIFFVLATFFQTAFDYLISKSVSFVMAQWIAISALILNVVFNTSARNNIKNEYTNFITPFKTNNKHTKDK